MSTAVLGPAFRAIQQALKTAADAVRREVDKLIRKISKRLRGNRKTQFDNDTSKDRKTRGRLRGATRTLGKIVGDIEDAGEMVSKELTDLEALLWALIDMLRALESLEDAEKHFDEMAKAYGG
ncbi:hypothetical protein [Dongia deserti]|uniref:hypothetical protein n=1 Tax=Dongia deserti TaxID=2268030 RepID=UPI000E649F42|nr:hypothetical protein [Dongia deserti]